MKVNWIRHRGHIKEPCAVYGAILTHGNIEISLVFKSRAYLQNCDFLYLQGEGNHQGLIFVQKIFQKTIKNVASVMVLRMKMKKSYCNVQSVQLLVIKLMSLPLC